MKKQSVVEERVTVTESPDEKLKWYQIYAPSVEITMFLYMIAYLIPSVYEQAWFVYRACRVNHGYSEEICSNLELHNVTKTIVQKTVSNFHQWNQVLGQIVPIILALFIGSWSDRRGRKLPLILGLSGQLCYSVMLIVNMHQETWPLEYVIYTATIPSALTGGDVAIFGACYSYISDVSTVKHRTFRVTLLETCYLSAMPIGVALGTYLYNNVVGKSYSTMFIITAALLASSIIYSLIFLKWQTTDQQRSIRGLGFIGAIKDFFDKTHVIDSFKTLTKKRLGRQRLYLWIFMFAMAFYTFQRDEKQMLYLYAQLKLNWNANTFSIFKIFQSSAFVIVMLCGIPIMNKLLGFRDTTIVMIGAASHALARIFYVFAKSSLLFYVGAAAASLGPVVAPVLRSMTSKNVSKEERGKIFALLSVFDNAVPILSSVLYSQVYSNTLETFPAAIFLLTLSTQVIVFLLISIVHVTLGKNELHSDDEGK